MTIRPQTVMPHAPDVPEISTVVFRRPDGSFESYRIPWTKSGLPLTSVGRVALRLGLHKRFADHIPESILVRLRGLRNSWYSRKFQSATEAS